MSKHKFIDKICIAATVVSLLLAVFFLCKGIFSLGNQVKEMGYEDRLFDTSKVHTIDIVMDDWDSFIENCQNEEYQVCQISVDGEVYKNVGIRGKGNTSLSSVSGMGSERYSFKVEFDKYDEGKNYFGLDKLSLNNLIQDNTFMKDYLTYRMMNEFGVDSPLCSFVYITVNGEDWGLYLAVEGVEDAFLQRNYGTDYGELYKPDSMSFGGGRGNGKGFDFSAGGFSMGSSDVKLQYIDNDPESYSNIFDNAKTDVSSADKKRLISSLQILSSGENVERVVDVDEVIRYFVVHNFVCNGDSYTGSMIHNYYMYEDDGLLSMIPWDYNLAYGTFQGGDATEQVNSPIDTPVSGGSTGDRPMIDWMLEDEGYLELYHRYFEEFLENVDFVSIIEEAERIVSEYVEKDPTKFCTYEEYLKGVETLKEFCLCRRESVQGQLNGEIPSTTIGQKEDETMLTDASHINLSDMGTMDGTMGFGERGQGERPVNKGQFKGDFQGEFPAFQGNESLGEDAGTEGNEKPDMSQIPEGFDISQISEEFDVSQIPDSFSFGNNMNGGINSNIGDYILLAVSIAVLIVGLLVAYKFNGKNS